MGARWTLERRARQAELIKTWRPWEQSTGPKTQEGKARSSRNADKGKRQEQRELRELLRLLREQSKALETIG